MWVLDLSWTRRWFVLCSTPSVLYKWGVLRFYMLLCSQHCTLIRDLQFVFKHVLTVTPHRHLHLNRAQFDSSAREMSHTSRIRIAHSAIGVAQNHIGISGFSTMGLTHYVAKHQWWTATIHPIANDHMFVERNECSKALRNWSFEQMWISRTEHFGWLRILQSLNWMCIANVRPTWNCIHPKTLQTPNQHHSMRERLTPRTVKVLRQPMVWDSSLTRSLFRLLSFIRPPYSPIKSIRIQALFFFSNYFIKPKDSFFAHSLVSVEWKVFRLSLFTEWICLNPKSFL